MIRLDTTTTSLEITLAGAITTTQPQVTVGFSTKTSTAYTGSKTTIATNNTSNVTIVAAPAASAIVDVDYISILNRDTVSITFQVQYNISGSRTPISRMTLASGDMAVYVHGQGWAALDSLGNTKTSASGLPTGVAGGDLSGTYPNPTVAKINGATLGTTTATNTNLLIADGTQWNSVTASGAWTITNAGVATLATVQPATGGTGITSYTVGDLLYASGATAISKLADVATGNALISGGVATAPSWGKIGLTTHVSGVLPVANGGTNASSASITAFNNITGYTASGATGTTSTNLVFSASPTLTGTPLTSTAAENTNTTQIATTEFVNANIAGKPGANGNTSTNNSTTPNTQFDLTAQHVVLMNSNGHIVVRTSPGTITNNISTVGSTANGRDQAGAFSSSSWIYFYWIWNGTTLATLSSTNSTSPTLPSGYTHWCYCTAARIDGSGNLIKIRCEGEWAFYEARITGVLSGGTATSETSVSTATVVPPNALEVQGEVVISGTASGAGDITIVVFFRVVSGSNFYATAVQLTSLTASSSPIFPNISFRYPNISQNFYYLITNTTGTGTLTINSSGYRNPF